MKLYFATQGQAQSKADSLHAWLITNTPAYADSVKAGETLRWDVPHQDIDLAGNPVGTQWYVNVDQRCMGALTDKEAATLK